MYIYIYMICIYIISTYLVSHHFMLINLSLLNAVDFASIVAQDAVDGYVGRFEDDSLTERTTTDEYYDVATDFYLYGLGSFLSLCNSLCWGELGRLHRQAGGWRLHISAFAFSCIGGCFPVMNRSLQGRKSLLQNWKTSHLDAFRIFRKSQTVVLGIRPMKDQGLSYWSRSNV